MATLGPKIGQLATPEVIEAAVASTGLDATAAEVARDEAEAAALAAQAVPTTTDGLIAGRINDPASATATALTATILDEVDGLKGAPSGIPSLDAGAKIPDSQVPDSIARLAALAATFRPASTMQRPPVETIITDFQAGHAWTATGTGTADLNYTADFFAGSQCVRLTTAGAGVEYGVQRFGFTAIDLTDKVFVLPIKIVSGYADLLQIRALIGDSSFTNNRSVMLFDGNSSTKMIREGEWFPLRFTIADQTSVSGTPNIAAVNAIRLAIRDKNTGTPVVVEFGKLAYYTPAADPVVVLWFDDSFPSHFTKAAPYLSRYGMVANEAVICSKIGTTGLTSAQLHSLAEVYGWEVSPHSFTVASHDSFDTFNEAQYVDEFNSIKQWMADNGFGANDHFAYAKGVNNPTLDNVAGRYFSSARTTNRLPVETIPASTRMRIRCRATSQTTTLADVQAWVGALKKGNRLDIYFHDIVASGASTSTQMNEAVFKTIIDYLATSGVRVVTASQAWQMGA